MKIGGARPSGESSVEMQTNAARSAGAVTQEKNYLL